MCNMQKLLLVVSVVCVLVSSWRGGGGLWARARELDPGACAARFDVQRDKIIRTEESREMGARYLSELDVGSRHECRRLCCETDSCDVFVYEEKSPGSCYLFKCGPPEDFRCKFTAHGNFSSGVLALSRRLAELQDQEHLPPPPVRVPRPSAPSRPAATTTTTTTPPPPPPPPPPRLAAAGPAPASPLVVGVPTHIPTFTQRLSGHCKRYQWECHSGGECVAVYNVCDGIPQCADGSDEAPEGCRDYQPPAAPAPAPAPAPHVAPRPSPPPVPPQQPVYPMQMYESEAIAEAGAGADAGERWPHRLLQAQPPRYPPADMVIADGAVEGGSLAAQAQAGADVGAGAGPHIFSHKGGLVQEEPPLSPLSFDPPPAQPWPRRTWTAHQNIENNGWGGWGREWADDRRAWPSPPARQQVSPYMGMRTMPELPVPFVEQGGLHDAPKKGPPPARPAPSAHPAPQPTPPPPAAVTASANNIDNKDSAVKTESKAVSENSLNSQAHAQHAAAAAAVRGGAADEHDGLSEHPPAAVMLLILGVLMTGTMGVLVGCRARAARRRLRRGGKPFAHDADYLVNGMYL